MIFIIDLDVLDTKHVYAFGKLKCIFLCVLFRAFSVIIAIIFQPARGRTQGNTHHTQQGQICNINTTTQHNNTNINNKPKYFNILKYFNHLSFI
jgi:hypothetical protein